MFCKYICKYIEYFVLKVRTNGLSRRTSFRSQPLPGQQKSLPVPVSIPKSPLLMNGDVTTNVTSAQQLTSGALAGPQAPPILKRSTANFNPHSIHQVCKYDFSYYKNKNQITSNILSYCILIHLLCTFIFFIEM